METTIHLITFVWTIIYIITLYYVYFHNSKPYLSEFIKPVLKDRPSKLNISELSYLFYHKINERTLIATVINLINKDIVKLENEKLVLNQFDPSLVSYDEKFVLDLLFKKLNKNNRNLKFDTLRELNNDKLTVVLTNYGIYKNLSLKCVGINMFEEKNGKSISLFVQFLGVMLLVLNYFLSIHSMQIYLIILPIIFMSVFYKNTYKRKYKYNTQFFKWKAYKNYLLSKETKETEDLVYLELFTSLSPLGGLNHKFVVLEEVLEQMIKKAVLNGSRGFNGNKNKR